MQPLTKESLTNYCSTNWSGIVNERRGNPGPNPKAAATLGFKVYEKARSRTCDIAIIGPNRIRENEELCYNVGLVIGNLSKKEIKEMRSNPGIAYKTDGAILGEKQWSGLINDLFMLGAVHACKTFHLSTEDGRELSCKEVWDEKNRALTSTGRELLLLNLAGYRKITDEETNLSLLFSHVFVPPISPAAISLEEYRSKIKQCNGPEEIITLFNRSISWDEYSDCP